MKDMRVDYDKQWFLDGLEAYLARHQLKQTKQRKEIVAQFLQLGGHIEAEDLYASLKRSKGQGIGLATVYRTLNLLKDAGLVVQSSFVEGKAVFERVKPGQHHDHLLCIDCGKIVEFEQPEIEKLQQEIAQKHGFQLMFHKLELYGKCLNPASCS